MRFRYLSSGYFWGMHIAAVLCLVLSIGFAYFTYMGAASKATEPGELFRCALLAAILFAAAFLVEVGAWVLSGLAAPLSAMQRFGKLREKDWVDLKKCAGNHLRPAVEAIAKNAPDIALPAIESLLDERLASVIREAADLPHLARHLAKEKPGVVVGAMREVVEAAETHELITDGEVRQHVRSFCAALCQMYLCAVRTTRDFGEYCYLCANMLGECPEGEEILTVQTSFSPGDHAQRRRQLRAYLQTTAKLLCKRGSTDNNWVGMYRRLVVVDPRKTQTALALTGEWLEVFMTYARSLETRPSMVNIELGFISAAAATEMFYGDWDIHITSDSCSSLAFQCGILHANWWGASIHLMDERRLHLGTEAPSCINTMLKEGFRALWARSSVLEFSKIPGIVTKSFPDLEAEILASVQEKVEEVVQAESPAEDA